MNERNSIKLVYLRAGFYWAFVQTSNAKFGMAGSRQRLIRVLARNELTLPVMKRVLTMICHRVGASRPAGYVGIEGLLQFLEGVMTLAKQHISPQSLNALKEFMISRLNHLRAMCMTSVPSGVRDGKLARFFLV